MSRSAWICDFVSYYFNCKSAAISVVFSISKVVKAVVVAVATTVVALLVLVVCL